MTVVNTVLSQATAESMWTAEEALAWAKKNKNWTARRYRLEGSRAGNSRLVTQATAQKLRSKYGGSVIQILPDYDPDRPKPESVVAAEGLPQCPECAVPESEPCRKPSGSMRKPHAIRRRVRERAEEVVGMPACPTCDALEGRPCRTPENKHRKPHSARLKLAAQGPLPLCAACKAPEGTPCIKPDGTVRLQPHKRRVRAVDDEAAE